MYELAGAVVGPLLATFLAGLGVWLRDWRRRRDDEYRRDRALSRATEEVAFIEAWTRAFEQVSEPSAKESARARARNDLERAYAVLASSGSAEVGTGVIGEGFREPVTLRRVLGTLLMFPLHSKLAKVGRIVYYLSLLWALLWTGVGSSVMLEDGARASDVLISAVLILVFGIAPAGGLGAIVWALDRRVTNRFPVPAPTTNARGMWQVPTAPSGRPEDGAPASPTRAAGRREAPPS